MWVESPSLWWKKYYRHCLQGRVGLFLPLCFLCIFLKEPQCLDGWFSSIMTSPWQFAPARRHRCWLGSGSTWAVLCSVLLGLFVVWFHWQVHHITFLGAGMDPFFGHGLPSVGGGWWWLQRWLIRLSLKLCWWCDSPMEFLVFVSVYIVGGALGFYVISCRGSTFRMHKRVWTGLNNYLNKVKSIKL